MTIQTDIPASVLQLSPDFTPPELTEITESSLANYNSLNDEQKTAFDIMYNYVRGLLDPQVRAIVLKGYAGTGKTYTIGELMKKIIMLLQMQIAMTAPTNKAVKVLRQSAKFKHRLVKYKTIHSLLGLKEDIDPDTGKQSFVPDTDPDNQEAIRDVGVLILDETSMLPNELFNMIDPYIEKSKLKIIYMGDPAQIPPVNAGDCIPFLPRERTRKGIKELVLEEIVRQKVGNPILELATATRENLNSFNIPYPYKTSINDRGEGIVMINKADKDKLFEVCDHYFNNPRFHHDSDFMKVIAWTNVTVDWMNERIRTLIYKDEYAYATRMAKETAQEFNREFDPSTVKLPRILRGEKLIADKPITCPDEFSGKRRVQFTTNDEFEVVDYEMREIDVFGNFTVTVYETQVEMTDDNGKTKKETINIVHESGEANYKHILNLLKKRALDEKDRGEKKVKWRHYYSVMNKFAEVKYNYAITCHKSQGSTYDNCIVVEADIDKSKNIVERNRIKYVAYTRARNLLFIVK